MTRRYSDEGHYQDVIMYEKFGDKKIPEEDWIILLNTPASAVPIMSGKLREFSAALLKRLEGV